ncbi:MULTISPECIES: SprT family protein [Staphylococcus]|uniref:Protein SprT-like n=1 Tax=Staphylococcus agnetis TaxID=985762 RepID=A0ABX3Z4X5_9STAP|nr:MULTISPECIES: SprT family protein [Staphylococcus]ALN76952.1 SprT family protein [Staphylococcus agnetis]MBY7664943.1 SprT family protein [Staphylococcus agnetis]MCO4326280.1 SprT family protein [Staphylococcus agnetis]MCO4357113.1 SprT family protein [Staphylococcus agnetis]MCO4362083.1 SprT family protein [Staphylococcus agnetis]
MDNETLQSRAESIALTYFGRPFIHRIYFNHRLRTTGGRYLLKSHDIEINPKQYEHFGEAAIDAIIKHELCHYFLHLDGKGYQHRDSDFKKLSQMVHAPRFCTPTETYRERANYEYMCTKCHQKFLRIRKVNTRKMRCGRCGGGLKITSYLS